MESTALTLLFAAALMASLLVKFWLATRQMRHVAAHRDAVPAPFAKTITLAAHQKARELGDQIPFGQPILVGHHSENRMRRHATASTGP
jgi:hypothetical protein